jgi:PPOX class probable FMN-dependent enzyme
MTFVETEEQLGAFIRIHRPAPGKPDKQLDFIDPHARAFIGCSPMVILGTADAEGRIDVSPRGDPPGFVQVLGERTLLIPDRKGNNRVDSMRNVLSTGRAGLLFLIPGRGDTLRVNGRARVTSDPVLLERCTVEGKAPALGILVEVEEVFFHCARSFLRGGIWQPERWPDVSSLATLGRALRDQMNLAEKTPEELDDWLEQAYCDLY